MSVFAGSRRRGSRVTAKNEAGQPVKSGGTAMIRPVCRFDAQGFFNGVYTAQYCVELAFSLARVRVCTLPSGKPCSPCLACIYAVKSIQ